MPYEPLGDEEVLSLLEGGGMPVELARVSVRQKHQRVLSGTRGVLHTRVVAVPLLVLLVGCSTIRLVSQYDDQTDQAVTAFGRKIDGFLTTLERNAGQPAALYQANVSFYDGARVDIRAMQTRAEATPKNEITRDQLTLLLGSLDDLEGLHKLKKKGIPPDEVLRLRSAFRASCGAILKFELAKKRGEGEEKK